MRIWFFVLTFHESLLNFLFVDDVWSYVYVSQRKTQYLRRLLIHCIACCYGCCLFSSHLQCYLSSTAEHFTEPKTRATPSTQIFFPVGKDQRESCKVKSVWTRDLQPKRASGACMLHTWNIRRSCKLKFPGKRNVAPLLKILQGQMAEPPNHRESKCSSPELECFHWLFVPPKSFIASLVSDFTSLRLLQVSQCVLLWLPNSTNANVKKVIT